MAEREWKASGAAAATAPFEPAAAFADAVRPAGPQSNGQTASWEEVYRTATSTQRQELLALASRQGLLYSHQLPATNGHKPHEDSQTIATLTRLLEGRTDLSPSAPQPIQPHDPRLDRMQCEAVARALATPDICLIGGPAGVGKSRVVAEILTQAAVLGKRVLFLARRPAALDLVLAQLTDRHVLFPLRCLEAGEKPDLLPAVVRSLTFAEHVRKLREALPEAVHKRQQTENRCRSRRHEQALWPQLLEVAEQVQKLAAEREEVGRQHAAVPTEVAQEAGQIDGSVTASAASDTFAAVLAGEQRRHAETLAEVDVALSKIEQARAASAARLRESEAETNRLRPLVAAKKERRFWSVAWWRALVNGRVAARLAESENREAELRATVAAAFDELNCLHLKRGQLDDEYRAAIEQVRQGEVRRRQENLASREAGLAQAWQALQAQWNNLLERLELEQTRPVAMLPQAVDQARHCWQEHAHADEESCHFAGQWAGFLQESLETLPQQLPGLVNLVAATPAGLAADKHFSRGAADFDMLVVDEAEQINEAELLNVGRRARCWVLVGNPGQEKSPGNKTPVRNGRVHGIPSRHKIESVAATGAGPVSLFQRLWRSYRCEVAASPHGWVREADRLCCRLKAIDAEQRRHLECERVADFPDIELRILTLPRAVPALVEVVFPSSMSLIQAKEYIYRELQELPLETVGASTCLVEDADLLVLHFGRITDQAFVSVTLEEGLYEGLAADATHPAGWRTCRLEFHKAAGWHREGVQAWLAQRCNLRDSGRTAFLQHSYGTPRAPADKPMCTTARGASQLYAGS